ncbi:hypothetical protein R3P38DRAFT_3164772 [Favolaschia claudopus]|uniref:Uncharacterized protein n=1 Tax=Favolaschia claudopus TaxID=2862362 RepID=A0AAW0EGT0_9AGAR
MSRCNITWQPLREDLTANTYRYGVPCGQIFLCRQSPSTAHVSFSDLPASLNSTLAVASHRTLIFSQLYLTAHAASHCSLVCSQSHPTAHAGSRLADESPRRPNQAWQQHLTAHPFSRSRILPPASVSVWQMNLTANLSSLAVEDPTAPSFSRSHIPPPTPVSVWRTNLTADLIELGGNIPPHP